MEGHIQGNITIGNDKKNLLSVITQLLSYVGYPGALNVIKWAKEIVLN